MFAQHLVLTTLPHPGQLQAYGSQATGRESPPQQALLRPAQALLVLAPWGQHGLQKQAEKLASLDSVARKGEAGRVQATSAPAGAAWDDEAGCVREACVGVLGLSCLLSRGCISQNSALPKS